MDGEMGRGVDVGVGLDDVRDFVLFCVVLCCII